MFKKVQLVVFLCHVQLVGYKYGALPLNFSFVFLFFKMSSEISFQEHAKLKEIGIDQETKMKTLMEVAFEYVQDKPRRRVALEQVQDNSNGYNASKMDKFGGKKYKKWLADKYNNETNQTANTTTEDVTFGQIKDN